MSDNGAEGALLEAAPLFGSDLEKYFALCILLIRHVQNYYDNPYENIGRRDS